MHNLVPQDVTFSISSGEELTFRPWNFADKLWFKSEILDKNSNVTNSNMDIEAVIRIAFRLLKDKSIFKPIKTEEYNENGEVEIKMIGGWKLMATKFVTDEDVNKLTLNVTAAMKAGDPIIDKNEAVDENVGELRK